MQIHEYTDAYWPSVWPIFRKVVTAGETLPYDPEWTSEQARSVWVVASPGATVVAVGELKAEPGGGSNRALLTRFAPVRRPGE